MSEGCLGERKVFEFATKNEFRKKAIEELLDKLLFLNYSIEEKIKILDYIKYCRLRYLDWEKELLLESLIKAYGFEDAVVVMGLESESVNVIAKSSELTTDDAIKIYTIVSEETGIAPENVKIIPIS